MSAEPLTIEATYKDIPTYEVSFTGEPDTYTHNGAATATQGVDYTVTVSAKTGYVLSDTIVVKRTSSKTLTRGTDYTYDPSTGVVTIKGEAITGYIQIFIYTDEAPAEAEIYVGGVGLVSGEYLANGSNTPVKDKPASGGYAYYKDGVLTLHDYSYTGAGDLYNHSTIGEKNAIVYYEGSGLELVLEGTNTLTQTMDDVFAVMLGDETNLKIVGTGSLNININLTARGKQSAIYCNTFRLDSGSVTLSVLSEAAPVFPATTYVLRCNEMLVNGGELTVNTTTSGALRLNGNATVNGGTITIHSYYNCIYPTNNIYTVTVNGGTLDLRSDYSSAINYKPVLGNGVSIMAAKKTDGELGEYDAENHDLYCRLYITKATSEDTFSVIVVNGTADITDAKVGDKITLSAGPAPDGKSFDKWIITDGEGFLLSDPRDPNATFFMVADNITVEATYKYVVSKIVATTDISSILIFGEELKNPSFTITEGSPASYNNAGVLNWEMYDEATGKWITMSFHHDHTVTEGKYRLVCRFGVYTDAYKTHTLAKDATVEINGVEWTVRAATEYADTYCHMIVVSPEFTVECVHAYDNACDPDCNYCGEQRTVSHDYSEATCTAKAKCSVCGDEKGELAPHTPGADDGDCTTAITCSACGTETTPAKASHTGGTATCTAKAKCSVCEAEYGELAEHKYSEATCTAKAKCSVCGDEKGELAPHSYVEGKCSCGATDPNYVAPHEHTFVEGKCECGETDPNYTPGTDTPGTDTPGNDDPQTPDDNDGLGTGAIVGIVVGSVAVAGVGGFALIWFVIKKKTWAEFLAIFKKG